MNTTRPVYKWIVLVVLFLNIMFGFGTVNIIAPLSLEIDQDIGLTIAQVTAVFAFYTLASPIFSPIGGVMADKYGARKVLTIAGLILSAASVGRYFVSSGNQLIAVMFVAGAGFACFGPVIPKALSTVFTPKEFGKANGIVFSAFWVGSTLAFALSASVLSPALGGWRMTALVIGVLSALMAIIWGLVFRDDAGAVSESPVDADSKPPASGSFTQMIKNPNIIRLSLFYALCVAGLFTILSVLPRVLEDRGIEQPGMLAALLTGAMVAFNILGGMISDRVGRKPVLVVSALLFGLCIPLMLLSSGVMLAIVLLVAGAAAGPIIPVSTAMPVEMPDVGPALAGTALGVLFMIGNLGGFFGPLIAGKMIEVTGTPWSGFLFVAVLLFLAPLILMKLQEPERGHD
jgi:MFS family permease